MSRAELEATLGIPVSTIPIWIVKRDSFNAASHIWTVPNGRVWYVYGITSTNNTVSHYCYANIKFRGGIQYTTQPGTFGSASIPANRYGSAIPYEVKPMILPPGTTIEVYSQGWLAGHTITACIVYEERIL